MVELRTSSRPTQGRQRRRYRLRAATSFRRSSLPLVDAGALNTRPSAHDSLRAPLVGLAGRRFLIVTAPFGPFGRVLAETLEARGASVERMIFNAGDILNWPRRGGVVFQASAEDWVRRAAGLDADYTDIVLFGEGGPYNRAVLSAAGTLEARVWVMENGYFRPDWITVERNGVNASSSLPRIREGYGAPAPAAAAVQPVGKILPHHVTNISLYHLVQWMVGPLFFPAYKAPYTAAPPLQCLGHIRRYIRLAFQPRARVDADVIAARGPFFLACLQREGDAQLLRYSRYADNIAFLSAVLSSFAANAPADARLVVKNHPLDPGLLDLAGVTRRLARERGLDGRIDFIDGGNLARLCRASRGMVVNNSSAALSALGFGTPVKALGDAFFDFEGLTDQQPLDGFWSRPQAPEADLFARFRAHVIARTQVNGNFHDPRAIRRTARGVAEVFETTI